MIGAHDRGQSPWRAAFGRLTRDRSALVGCVVLLLLALIGGLGERITPYSCSRQLGIIEFKNLPPSFAHPFGTDQFSRDVFSRLICGTRVSLSIAFLSVAAAATVGTAYGAIAGYVGGRLDTAMMRVVDALLAIPRVLVLIAIATLWNGIGAMGLVLILGFTGWFAISRLVRTLVMGAREDEFVTAARALGASHPRILVQHILPQVISPVLVAATLAIGNVIVIEAGLSSLGMGIQEPQASWGSVFQNGVDSIMSGWWVSVFAGLALVITVLAANLVADGLRDALNTRQLPAR